MSTVPRFMKYLGIGAAASKARAEDDEEKKDPEAEAEEEETARAEGDDDEKKNSDDEARAEGDEDKDEAKGCPSCGYKPFAKRCMACGFERQSAALIEHEPGEMREVMMGKKKLADDRRHLWEQVCSYARAHSAPERQSGRAWHLYQKIIGSPPPKTWRFDDTPNAVITRNVRNKILSLNMAYVKAKGVAA